VRRRQTKTTISITDKSAKQISAGPICFSASGIGSTATALANIPKVYDVLAKSGRTTRLPQAQAQSDDVRRARAAGRRLEVAAEGLGHFCGAIRTHGTVTRTTVFETAPAQIEIGGRVNSRWLEVQDLDLFSSCRS
jgi:hypothetical protein